MPRQLKPDLLRRTRGAHWKALIETKLYGPIAQVGNVVGDQTRQIDEAVAGQVRDEAFEKLVLWK